VSGSKRPAQGDWYSPYFAPTTVLVAISVLFLSIEAGKYTGAYLIQRDKAAQAALTTPMPDRATTKATNHHAPARSHAVPAGMTHQ
jgi:hypothetical protein